MSAVTKNQSDFIGVCDGFVHREFDGLDAGLKRKMLTLMARISEKSYRRGFQQGHECERTVIVDLLDWRFPESQEDCRYDVCPSPFGDCSTTAIDRLFMEVQTLREIGLTVEDFE